MDIIDKNINELAAMGCYTGEELKDLRERFISILENGFWQGSEYSRQESSFTFYGKREDF